MDKLTFVVELANRNTLRVNVETHVNTKAPLQVETARASLPVIGMTRVSFMVPRRSAVEAGGAEEKSLKEGLRAAGGGMVRGAVIIEQVLHALPGLGRYDG